LTSGRSLGNDPWLLDLVSVPECFSITI